MSVTLLLMRHAKAVDFVPGGRDIDRPLADRGHGQAAAAGAWLHSLGRPVDALLCSPAVRTRETAAGLGLGLEPVIEPSIYDAAPEEILAAVGLVERATTLLVVGHAPGVPGLVGDLPDPERSAAAAVDELGRSFPTAAIAVLRLTGPWSDLEPGELQEIKTFR